MRGEGTQALFDALLIANICEDLLKDSDLRMLVCGNVQTCLGHKCEQAHRFERNRFTTCVRARNHHHEEFVPQVEVDRHYFSGQQWMACIVQVHIARVVQARFGSAHHASITCLCQVQIELCQ